MYHVSSNPHIRDEGSTAQIMRDVLLALLPATAFGIYNFGFRAFIVVIVSIFTCVATEAIYQKLMKQKITISDLSAAVTGLLLALNLPHTLPIWMVVLGGIFAIIVVKQVFGGIGQNFMNPALAARCFLLISFTQKMTNFELDGVSGATPLALLKAGENVSLSDMFVGTIAGTIGETSVIAILLGGIYLLSKHIIDFRIPFTYLISFAVFAFFFGGSQFDFVYVAKELCGGGIMLGAFFMATDYSTSPITQKGRIIYGVFLGILTGVFRIFGASAEGVSYAIIFGNLLVPLIERMTMKTAFGIKRGGIK